MENLKTVSAVLTQPDNLTELERRWRHATSQVRQKIVDWFRDETSIEHLCWASLRHKETTSKYLETKFDKDERTAFKVIIEGIADEWLDYLPTDCRLEPSMEISFNEGTLAAVDEAARFWEIAIAYIVDALALITPASRFNGKPIWGSAEQISKFVLTLVTAQEVLVGAAHLPGLVDAMVSEWMRDS